MENKVSEFQNGFIGKFFVKRPVLFLVCFAGMIFVFVFLCLNVKIPVYEEVNGTRMAGMKFCYRLDQSIDDVEGTIFFYADKREKVYSCNSYAVEGNILEMKPEDSVLNMNSVTFEIQTGVCTLLEAIFENGGNL